MNSRSGLSLFELLVALALLALIARGLAGTMGLAVNMWDRSASLSASAEEIALRSRLRIWLRNAVPPSRLMPFPTHFEGSEDGFSFVTLSETPFAPDAAALRVTVMVEGKNLVLRAQALDDRGKQLESFVGELARDFSPRISYIGNRQNTSDWQDLWKNTGGLPSLIRVETEKKLINWPTFISPTAP